MPNPKGLAVRGLVNTFVIFKSLHHQALPLE